MKGIEKFELGSSEHTHKRGFWRKTKSFLDFSSMSMAFSVAENTFKYTKLFHNGFPTDNLHPSLCCIGMPYRVNGKTICEMNLIPDRRISLLKMIGKKIKLDGMFCAFCITKECKFILGDLIIHEGN